MAGAGQHLPRAKARYLLRKRIANRLQEASSEAQHRGEEQRSQARADILADGHVKRLRLPCGSEGNVLG
jgi:hypothetical protein